MKVPTSVLTAYNRYRQSGKIDAPAKQLDEKTAGMVHDLAQLDFWALQASDGSPEDLDGKKDGKVHTKDPSSGESRAQFQGDYDRFRISSKTDLGQGYGSLQLTSNSPETLTLLDLDWQEGAKATATAYEINKENLSASVGYQMTWQLA